MGARATQPIMLFQLSGVTLLRSLQPESVQLLMDLGYTVGNRVI